MQYYDHGLVGATVAVAIGAQRRYGWAAVALAALVAMFPDWDAATKHTYPSAYERGHRVWGHNLFAVAAAGAVFGALGYWIDHSRSQRFVRSSGNEPGGVGPWIALGLCIMLSHPLLDLLYCGWEREAAWPVGLFWPIVPTGFALPWMPWSDRGATAVLAAGLCLCLAVRRPRQGMAILSLVVLSVYIGIRGAVLQWG